MLLPQFRSNANFMGITVTSLVLMPYSFDFIGTSPKYDSIFDIVNWSTESCKLWHICRTPPADVRLASPYKWWGVEGISLATRSCFELTLSVETVTPHRHV